MRKATIILLPLTLALSACDQNARDFARNARAILDQYAARLDREIRAESQYYEREAVLEVKHRHENLVNSIKADRAERGSDLAVALSGDKLNLAAEIGAATQSVSDTKSDFDKLICDDIAARLATASGKDQKSFR